MALRGWAQWGGGDNEEWWGGGDWGFFLGG